MGFGEPHLPRLESWILAGDKCEIHVGSDALGHLADRRRQPARATVGDARIHVLGTHERVDQQLLDDRVADLHAGAGDLTGGGIHRGRREGRSAYPVASRRPTEHDHPIARVRSFVDCSGARGADTTSEHERVRRVRRVVQNCSGNGRKADLVAVVGDAVDHALLDAAWMQRTVGEVIKRQVCRPETQHVGDGDRSMGDTEHVADHASHPGVRAAERLDSGRMVVCLGLQRKGGSFDELDDTGVPDERRANERSVDLLGARTQLLHQRFATSRTRLARFGRVDDRLKGLV